MVRFDWVDIIVFVSIIMSTKDNVYIVYTKNPSINVTV